MFPETRKEAVLLDHYKWVPWQMGAQTTQLSLLWRLWRRGFAGWQDHWILYMWTRAPGPALPPPSPHHQNHHQKKISDTFVAGRVPKTLSAGCSEWTVREEDISASQTIHRISSSGQGGALCQQRQQWSKTKEASEPQSARYVEKKEEASVWCILRYWTCTRWEQTT